MSVVLDLEEVIAHGTEAVVDGKVNVLMTFVLHGSPVAIELAVSKTSADTARELAGRLLGAAEHLSPAGYEIVRTGET